MNREANGVTGLLSCPCCGGDDIMEMRRFDGAGLVWCDDCGKGVLRTSSEGGRFAARMAWQQLDGYWEACAQD